MICLDTNIAIYVINRRVPAVRQRLEEQLRLGTEIGFPVIACLNCATATRAATDGPSRTICSPSFWHRGSRCFPSMPKTPRTPATSAPIWRARARRSAPMTVSSQPRRAAGADGDGLGDVMDAAVTAIEQNDGGADGPWSLPEGWTWAALSDLGTWMGGGIQGECGLLDQRNRSVGFTERHESRGYRRDRRQGS